LFFFNGTDKVRTATIVAQELSELETLVFGRLHALVARHQDLKVRMKEVAKKHFAKLYLSTSILQVLGEKNKIKGRFHKAVRKLSAANAFDFTGLPADSPVKSMSMKKDRSLRKVHNDSNVDLVDQMQRFASQQTVETEDLGQETWQNGDLFRVIKRGKWHGKVRDVFTDTPV
jgi:hypothetical protein